MKRRTRQAISFLMVLTMVLSLLPATAIQAAAAGMKGDNIAPDAVAEADYTNQWSTIAAVNDGELGTETATTTSWNTWGSTVAYPLHISYTWDALREISGMRIMWWADNASQQSDAGVSFPKSCGVTYYDVTTDSWEPITAMTNEDSEAVSAVGVKFNGEAGGINANNRYWNEVHFDKPVITTRIRLELDRYGTQSNGVGIGEWEVYGGDVTDGDKLLSAKITGNKKLAEDETAQYQAACMPANLSGVAYKWSVADGSDKISIQGDDNKEHVSVKAIAAGTAALKVTVSHEEDGGLVEKEAVLDIEVEGITGIDDYVTATTVGKAPILPKRVVANGIPFDDPTPDAYSTTNPEYNFAEEFNSKLLPVAWEAVDAASFGSDKLGKVVTVNGTVTFGQKKYPAKARVTVNEEAVAADDNSAVTFENVQIKDEFWLPKQKVNAVNSLNKALLEISKPSGGEPNFDNAIKKLNGEPYDAFQGFVFQDTDIYKSIEAISYTLSVIHDDEDEEMKAQKEILENKLASWIDKIEQVQYADGYINTHFTLRSATYSGGGTPGNHRWRDLSNHEMYNAGHFIESAVAYTRYREGIGQPDYSLYIVAKRFADHIVERFGPEGTRHEVPGHEEIELALVKLAKLTEEHEGRGTGQKYIDTAKLLIDRRGEDRSLRESGYKGGDYSQDARPFAAETNGVGHAVRATYLYAGATDIARLLPIDDEGRVSYLATLDAIWDSVANRKTYISGGIGVAAHGEDFGGDYELPNNGSYQETCASIALSNWNQRMNLVYEDAKYSDVVERALYNAILVGTNLEGNRFYYSSLLEVSGGNARSEWFGCACCPPNLMRTIASLSGTMYTTHKNDVFVNMYIGSEGHVNVSGTNVGLKQETKYPWEGMVALTVSPDEAKEFTMNIRIPGWVQEQKNKEVTIKVNNEKVTAPMEKGYVAIQRTWKKGDVISIDMPMEIRMTEADPNVTTNLGRIAIERGPIVYCMEKAGNAQLNESISDFNPLNFVIPRTTEFTAAYKEDLLKGVVEITGDVLYNDNGTVKYAKLQAVPYYAWNNRGDDGVYGQNSSSKMLIWTNAVNDEKKVGLNDAIVTAKSRKESLYTPESWSNLEKALEAANQVNDNDLATIEEIEAATAVLKQTINDLASISGNIATSAEVKADRENTAASNVNNGELAEGAATSWNTWANRKGYPTNISYKWKEAQEITGMRIMWWADAATLAPTGNVSFPKSCDVYYKEEGTDTWTKISAMKDENQESVSSVGVKYGTADAASSNPAGFTGGNNRYWNEVIFDVPVTTSELRLTIDRNGTGDNGIGAGEWEVFAEVNQEINKDALDQVIAFAKGKEQSEYTVESWDLFRKALTKAEEVSGNSNATQLEINAAAAELMNAATSLEQRKLEGTLTISCGGFTYNGTTKPNPRVVATTNTGAAVTYQYYSDQACTKEVAAPTNAGTYYVKGTAAETATHASVTSAAVSFTIAKAVPSYANPASIVLSAAEGKTLNDVKAQLPGGFAFEAPLATSVGAAGNNTFKVTFTPADLANYEVVKGLSVTIRVSKQNTAKVPKKNSTRKVGKFKYKVTKSSAVNGTVQLCSPNKKNLTSAAIPASIKIDGYTFKVTGIAANAFKNNAKLRKVTIGGNVKQIGKNAFAGCKKLKTIVVKSKVLHKIGKNALKGISPKAVIKVPDGKKKAYKKVFLKKGQGKSVKIK